MTCNCVRSPRRTSLAAVPAVVRTSPLMKQGGMAVYSDLVDLQARQSLLSEALARWPAASVTRVAAGSAEERGGVPARSFSSAPGGAVQQSWYSSRSNLEILRQLTHASLRPTGGAGTYSYYVRAGDFLALHRDIATCDVSVITCLNDLPSHAQGGKLCLYPGRAAEPLSEIRARPAEGACQVRLAAGQTIVFYGGIIPHTLLPVVAGQARIVSVLCYQIPS